MITTLIPIREKVRPLNEKAVGYGNIKGENTSESCRQLADERSEKRNSY